MAISDVVREGQPMRDKLDEVTRQIEKRLFGMPHAIHLVLRALITPVPYDAGRQKDFGPAHIFFDDIPGVGKTALVECLALTLEAKATRVNGTPDLMPSAFTGYEMFMRGVDGPFWVEGKLATHLLNFDEISRAPTKTQSALLEAMEERKVTESHVDLAARAIRTEMKRLYPVPDDNRYFFMVLATQNPIEQEGTNRLPEAQLDRFTFGATIGRPKRTDEKRIRAANVLPAATIDGTGKVKRSQAPRIETVMPLKEIVDIAQFALENIPLSDAADEYIIRLILNSNPGLDSRDKTTKGDLLRIIDTHVRGGMSPRSNFHLEAAARAEAFLCGDDIITPEHVRTVAPLVMSHRMILQPASIAGGMSGRKLVGLIIEHTRMEV